VKSWGWGSQKRRGKRGKALAGSGWGPYGTGMGEEVKILEATGTGLQKLGIFRRCALEVVVGVNNGKNEPVLGPQAQAIVDGASKLISGRNQ
jgi:hypothetical protein